MTRHAAFMLSPCSCTTHPKPEPLLQEPAGWNVTVRGLPAARVGDTCLCAGAPNALTTGNPTVKINGRPIAREYDFLAHGAIVSAIPRTGWDVVVGVPATTPSGSGVTIPPECAFLQGESTEDGLHMGHLRPPPADRFARHRKPFHMGRPSRGSHTNRNTDKATSANVTVVVVDGRPIKIIREDGALPPGTFLPTDQEVATSLSRISKEHLDGVDTVVISPGERRGNAAPADYARREVYLYPRGPHEPRGQGALDWQMTHELAHGHDHQKMVDDKAWDEAIAADGKFPSRYARETYAKGGGSAEDYADSVVMYALVRGTTCEGPARQMYPNRFALLDKYHGKSYR